MKRNDLIKIINTLWPKEHAMKEDSVGLQVVGKEDIKSVMITLDVTIDTIHQAIEKGVDMIIAHHPIFFEPAEEWFKNNPLNKAKYDLLLKQQINLFVCHTNADFSSDSISYNQAVGLELENIEHLENYIAVTGSFNKEKETTEAIEYIQNALLIKYDLRNNIKFNKFHKDLLICSGACGDILNHVESKNRLNLVGEMKYHNWVYAKENNIDVIEVGHFSENIFKDILEQFLLEEDITIYKSEEENAY